MSTSKTIIDTCFRQSPSVRYVAVYLHGRLELRSRAEAQLPGSDESDRFEELVVNPTLLKLLSQRGDIDCGGCLYVVVRYGGFHALVHPLGDGHVTVSFEPDCSLDAQIPRMAATIAGFAAAD